MRLRDVLAPERVLLPLEARTLPEAGAELLERVLQARGVLDAYKLRRRAGETPPEDAVAMGDRAFLLHYRTDAVGQLLVAIGIAPTPICRPVHGEEAQCARVVLLIAAPPRQAARYLQVVGGFARLLRKQEVFDAMLAARDPDELIGLSAFAEYRLPEQLTVRDVMSDHPRTVLADTPLKEAARMLVRAGLGALPVIDEGRRVVGMVSEREVIRHLLTTQVFSGADVRAAGAPGMASRTVRDVMSRQVMCVAPEQPIAEVASLMSNKDVDRVPVVREGQLVGFLTRGDIVRKLIGT
ncbi:MAG TPA: CBS domain-containing protein [Gemmatimonadaceae bacterium]|jgi:CBS domain-containing protein|nr:CBS domain-containing protein [Gemmatimonadaceae bacterium]